MFLLLLKNYWYIGVIVVLIGIIFGQNYYSRDTTGKLLALSYKNHQEELLIKEKYYEKSIKEKDEIIGRYTVLVQEMDHSHLLEVMELSRKQSIRIKEYEQLFLKDKKKIKELLIKHYNLEYYEK